MKHKSNIKYVNLHGSHTTFSINDGLGFPEDHMRYSHEIGLDAMAVTDHGNMNALGYQLEAYHKLKKENIEIKPIFGVEFYYIDSISDWKVEYEQFKELRKQEKTSSTPFIEDEDREYKKNSLKRRSHLVALAQNQIGLNNIFKLISDSFSPDNFYRFPRIDFDMLAQHNEGVVLSTACVGGLLASDYFANRDDDDETVLTAMINTTKKFQSVFGDRFYGELQWNSVTDRNGLYIQHIINQFIIQVSAQTNLKLITTGDVHYPHPKLWKDREIYKRLGWLGKANKDRPEWFESELPDKPSELAYSLFPKNGDQMWESYKKYSKDCGFEYDDKIVRESIERTYDVAHNQIESFLPDATIRLPSYVVPDWANEDEDYALAKLALEGLKSRGQQKNKDYLARLKNELYIIQSQKFSKYFLTMKSICDIGKQQILLGPARGSAAGSLVSYCLGITEVDPIKWNLQFERFLTKDSVGMPDIDSDWSDNDKLKNLLIEQWGENSVVRISNFNTLQIKSLIKDVSKFYGIPFFIVNNVTKKMVDEALPQSKEDNKVLAGVYDPTFDELKKYSKTLQEFLEEYPEVGKHVENLHGQVRSFSRHAGGVVVGEDLDRYMPIVSIGGIKQTPWNEGNTVRHLEPAGFIKFDLLGLSSLRMIETCIEHILKRYYNIESPTFNDIKQYYENNLLPDKIDLSDEKVWKRVFHKVHKAPGIFQMTNEGAQQFCNKAKPMTIEEFCNITALYRPGTLSVDADKKYLKAKKNPDKIKYEHEIIKEVLEKTSGEMVYQEQLAELAHKLGKDMSLSDGNLLRKALTKKGTGKTQEIKDKYHDKFVEGCLDKGLTMRQASDLWKKMEYFAGYSFNFCHSAAYSLISYMCAYLWCHYPECWAAAYLDKECENKDKKENALALIESNKFKIAQVDINKSGDKWEIDSGNKKILIPPLTSLKGLGEKAVDEIINNRPYNKLEEFIFNENISYRRLNKKSYDVLARAGAMDCLLDERFNHRKHLWKVVAGDNPKTQKKLEESIKEHSSVRDFTNEEQISNISSITGQFPVDRVLPEGVKLILQDEGIKSISQWQSGEENCWFIVRDKDLRKTRKNTDYLVIKAIDDTNSSFTIRCWRYTKNVPVYKNKVYIAKLEYSDEWGYSVREKNLKLL